jgi:hypothetical protein
MRANRSRARAELKAVKTRAEPDEWIDMISLTDDERGIARMVYGDGYGIAQVCFKTGYSRRQVCRKLVKIQDRIS